MRPRASSHFNQDATRSYSHTNPSIEPALLLGLT